MGLNKPEIVLFVRARIAAGKYETLWRLSEVYGACVSSATALRIFQVQLLSDLSPEHLVLRRYKSRPGRLGVGDTNLITYSETHVLSGRSACGLRAEMASK